MSAGSPTLAELLRRLAEKEDELAELKYVMELLFTTAKHQQLETDLNPLPLPRLELRGIKVEDGVEWRYSLVYRHFLDHIEFVPFGITRASGAGAAETMTGGKLHLPMRDGAHIHHDMVELNLPAFAIYGETIEQLEPLR